MDPLTVERDGVIFALGAVSAVHAGMEWQTDPARSWLIVNLSCTMTAFAAEDAGRLYIGAPTPGEFSWVPRGAAFTGRYGPGDILFLQIGAPPAWASPIWPVLANFDLTVAEAARIIAVRLRSGAFSGLAEQASMLWQSLLEAQPRPRRRRGALLSGQRFAAAQRAVARDPDGLRSARDLADRLGTPLDGLDRTFLEAFGLSAAGYLDAARLRNARRLLCSTDRPIAEIAMASGFASHAHMADRMRARLRVTPSALRAWPA